MVAPSRALALLLLLAGCRGWTTQSQLKGDPNSAFDEIRNNRGSVHRTWDFPKEGALLGLPGLDGPVSFAWDAAMCRTLDPLFGVHLWGFQFSSCGDVRAPGLTHAHRNACNTLHTLAIPSAGWRGGAAGL